MRETCCPGRSVWRQYFSVNSRTGGSCAMYQILLHAQVRMEGFGRRLLPLSLLPIVGL
jgi:hypothetical protein